MRYGIREKKLTGWRARGWRSCADLNTIEINGVPRWFRCQRCNSLVTHGQIEQGGCRCGNRRLHGARMLTWPEILSIKLGLMPLDAREYAEVKPLRFHFRMPRFQLSANGGWTKRLSRVHWRKNGQPARMDIADRYLAHLRWDMMNIAPPHMIRQFSPEKQEEMRRVLDANLRMEGAITMIGETRLEFLETAVRNILRRDVPGDFLEAGAWRGGACIYLRALLDVFGCRDRIVYVCDAFDDGFPEPDPRFPIDDNSTLHQQEYFKTSNVLVRAHFDAYGYNDEQVRFVCGYFKDTLPKIPAKQLALLRLDGDLYVSTWDSLEALYHRVSIGGYVIADDYYAIANSQRAVDDFRTSRRITEPIRKTDWGQAYWIKERE